MSSPDAFLGVTASFGGKRWQERLDVGAQAQALAMAQRYDLPDVVARVLAGRNVTLEQAETFLDPSLRDLMPDPSTLMDMDKATDRVVRAVQAGEQIAIFGDYDVDGATSAALLARFLTFVGLRPFIHIPDRLTEGYGPNIPAIEELKQRGATLLITVDCGSTSFEAFEAAAGLGLDVVTIDHHQVGVELPQVEALVNPNRQDDLSGQGNLAAVGVTFLFLVALNRALRGSGFYNGKPPNLLAWLDLVALGTVCDVVPLKGLNRAYVTKGLMVIRKRENQGLAALCDVARLNGPAAPYHLGFLIGPRINAGGRIGDAALGARLLLSSDRGEAQGIATELDRLNQERQAIEAIMLEEAELQVGRALVTSPDTAVIFAGADNWHPGIVGLIASRLKEAHRRPAFAIAWGENGQGTASGRSIPGVDLGAAVRAAVEEGILIKGGGHAMAAGLTVEREKLSDLEAFMDQRLAEDVQQKRQVDSLTVDGALTASGASLSLLETLEKAGPYGAGHSEPVFAFPSHKLRYADTVGSGHIRATIAGTDGTSLKAIAFRAADKPLGQALLAGRGNFMHFAGTLSIDYWQGNPKVQLRVIDAADPRKYR
ncbi:MAG: single-stranded-DNA-specific exonuclease RecJ [Stappiaceae bacterium]